MQVRWTLHGWSAIVAASTTQSQYSPSIPSLPPVHQAQRRAANGTASTPWLCSPLLSWHALLDGWMGGCMCYWWLHSMLPTCASALPLPHAHARACSTHQGLSVRSSSAVGGWLQAASPSDWRAVSPPSQASASEWPKVRSLGSRAAIGQESSGHGWVVA